MRNPIVRPSSIFSGIFTCKVDILDTMTEAEVWAYGEGTTPKEAYDEWLESATLYEYDDVKRYFVEGCEESEQ